VSRTFPIPPPPSQLVMVIHECIVFLPTRFAIGVFWCALVTITNAVFNTVATHLFLIPVLDTLRMSAPTGLQGSDVMSRRAVLLRKKYTTLAGVVAATVSSTLLSMNLVLFWFYRDSLPSKIWLDVYTFGFNIESVVSDVAILLAGGYLDPLLQVAFWSRRLDLVRKKKDKYAVGVVGGNPTPIFVPNSRFSGISKYQYRTYLNRTSVAKSSFVVPARYTTYHLSDYEMSLTCNGCFLCYPTTITCLYTCLFAASRVLKSFLLDSCLNLDLRLYPLKTAQVLKNGLFYYRSSLDIHPYPLKTAFCVVGTMSRLPP
jgi:hypothetical protein